MRGVPVTRRSGGWPAATTRVPRLWRLLMGVFNDLSSSTAAELTAAPVLLSPMPAMPVTNEGLTITLSRGTRTSPKRTKYIGITPLAAAYSLPSSVRVLPIKNFGGLVFQPKHEKDAAIAIQSLKSSYGARSPWDAVQARDTRWQQQQQDQDSSTSLPGSTPAAEQQLEKGQKGSTQAFRLWQEQGLCRQAAGGLGGVAAAALPSVLQAGLQATPLPGCPQTHRL